MTNNLSDMEYACPICDDYCDHDHLRKHILTSHSNIELADLLAFIVIDNAKRDLIEQMEA